MHKTNKLLIAAIVLSALAMVISSATYLHSSSQRARAETVDDRVFALKANLSADKYLIKKTPVKDVIKNLDTIDKATLTLTITNLSQWRLISPKWLIGVSGENTFGIIPGEQVKIDSNSPESSSQYLSYSIPDLEPGQTINLTVALYARQAGVLKIFSSIWTGGVAQIKIEPISIKVGDSTICKPRPSCLDESTPCRVAEPPEGWCSQPKPTIDVEACKPRPSCFYDATPCKMPEPAEGWCSEPKPTVKVCRPRPACLDNPTPCKLPEPVGGWCSDNVRFNKVQDQ